MKLALRNSSLIDVPIASSADDGWVEKLPSRKWITWEEPESTVWIIGDKPDFLDMLNQMGNSMLMVLRKMVNYWKDKHYEAHHTKEPTVEVTVENLGSLPVRILLGDPFKEAVLKTGETIDAEAIGYIELRELGE